MISTDGKDEPKVETAEAIEEQKELTEEDLEKIAGGRSPAEDFVKGHNPLGGLSGGGGSSGGGGGNLIAHEQAHVVRGPRGGK